MEELTRNLRARAGENDPRERALMAFLDLGERFKAIAGGELRHDEAAQSEADGATALFNTIEGEIIPRLMLAHRASAAGDASAAQTLTTRDRETFLQGVLGDNASAARRQADELLRRGVPREALLLDLLASCARRLGEMWEEDECDFTEVTIGLCRLHEVVRRCGGGEARAPYAPDGEGPRILLATACGDQHVFGVVIVADFLRRSGWRVTSEPGASQDDLADLLRERDYDVLGLSAACSADAQAIADEIAALRAASRNRQLKVLAGGRLFAENPDLVREVGADAFAGSANIAHDIGESLLAARAARR